MLLASCKARAVEPPCSPLLGLLCCYGRLPPEGKDQESVIGFFFFFFPGHSYPLGLSSYLLESLPSLMELPFKSESLGGCPT